MSVPLRALTLLALFALPLLSCEQETPPPEDLLEESLYLDMTAELYLILQWVELHGNEVDKNNLRQLVFDHYGVSVERFQQSHRYYQSDIDGQLIRLDSLRTRFDREDRRLNEHRSDF